MVAGDSNLVAENIKSGVSIFGVSGTLVEGGEEEYAKSIVNNIKAIGNSAFYSCSNLTYANFPACTTIGSEAFYNCNNLTTINFPAVITLNRRAFNNCRNLTTVSFPACTSIGSGAFGFCSNLSTINFPNVTSIGSGAFDYCNNLTTINFPAVTTIGSYAFGFCSNLTSASFPACTIIGSSAFYSCAKLTTISFSKVTTIGSNAFTFCSNLTSTSFPACTTISSFAFASCSNLATISFPVVTNIGSGAFRDCRKLKSFYLTGSSLCTLSNSNAFTSTPIGGYSPYAGTYGSIYVPASLLTSYQAATNWAYFSSRFVAFDGGANMITFTVGSTEYQAEEGMTWIEWCNSEYNTDEYIVEGNFVYDKNYKYSIDAIATETIIANGLYELI